MSEFPLPKENQHVDVRIGVTQTPKEIEVELPEGTDADALTTQIEQSLAAEKGVLWLTDRRGRRVGIPAERIAYVEVNAASDDRRVGFGAGVR
jgi:Protein of unknown function (DUF3107)